MRSENPKGSKSKSSAPLSPDAQARHDALVAAKALMQFPPNDGDPKIYQAWRACMEALLDYADGGLPQSRRPYDCRGSNMLAVGSSLRSAKLRLHPLHRRMRHLRWRTG